MEQRLFGKTGYQASVITLGGCGLGWLHEQEESIEKAQNIADEAIRTAFNAGINIIDVAPTYGEAEIRLRPWIKKYRNKIFLADKTMERTREGAWTELQQSLKRLGTKQIDLYQFHAVKDMVELNTIFGKAGALEAVLEAKETGLIKNIGITGHDNIQVLINAIERFDDFSTVLCPVNVASMAQPHKVNDYRPLLEIALQQDIGVTAIKAILKGRWQGEHNYQTWYEPLNDKKWIERGVWFTLSQEGVTTYSLPCDLRLWTMVIDAARRFRRFTPTEQENIVGLAKQNNLTPLFPEQK
jgi:aryl-alcohol dehydrogenase-like predicted oxidoreductase